MSTGFPTREQLMSMELFKLRDIPVEDPTDERILQEVINAKTLHQPLPEKVYNLDAQEANITTPEEEARWQAIIDERTAKVRTKYVGEEQVLKESVEKLEAEKVRLEEGMKAETSLPAENPIVDDLYGKSELEVGGIEFTKQEKENKELNSIVDSAPKVWCEECGSKGVKHKNGCPKLDKTK